jgi:hypothetical protein
MFQSATNFSLHPKHLLRIDSTNIILEGKSCVDQFPCITQSSLPHASIWSYPYFKVCTYLERTSFTAPWLDVSACLFLGRTDPYLEQSISCPLIPEKVSTFQVRSTESDDTVSSWSMFELWLCSIVETEAERVIFTSPYLRTWSHVLVIKLSISEVETRGD